MWWDEVYLLRIPGFLTVGDFISCHYQKYWFYEVLLFLNILSFFKLLLFYLFIKQVFIFKTFFKHIHHTNKYYPLFKFYKIKLKRDSLFHFIKTLIPSQHLQLELVFPHFIFPSHIDKYICIIFILLTSLLLILLLI